MATVSEAEIFVAAGCADIFIAVAGARSGLTVRGVFTFPGHSYGPGLPAVAVLDETR